MLYVHKTVVSRAGRVQSIGFCCKLVLMNALEYLSSSYIYFQLFFLQEPFRETKVNFERLHGIPAKDVSLQQYFDFALSTALVFYFGTPGTDAHVVDIFERTTGGFQLLAARFDILLQIGEVPVIEREQIAEAWTTFEKDLIKRGYSLEKIIRHSKKDEKKPRDYLFKIMNKIRDQLAMERVNVYSINVNM